MTVTINGTTGLDTPAITNNGAYTGDGISFADNAPSNSLVVNSSGNVGIGTSSPAGKLHVSTSSYNAAYLETTGASSDNVQLRFKGTSGERWAIGNNIATGGTGLNFDIYDLANNANRMRIDSSGNLLVGTTSIIDNTKFNFSFTSATNGIGTLTDTTATSYHMRFKNPNGVVGGVYTNGSNTTYTTSSDYRLKENIQPMTGALDVVQRLNPVTFNWKVDGSDGQGFIAHELQAVVPDCVGGEKDAVDEEGKPVYQGIDTSFLVATLTKAIQELKAQLDESNLILTDVRTELDATKAEVAALKGAA